MGMFSSIGKLAGGVADSVGQYAGAQREEAGGAHAYSLSQDYLDEIRADNPWSTQRYDDNGNVVFKYSGGTKTGDVTSGSSAGDSIKSSVKGVLSGAVSGFGISDINEKNKSQVSRSGVAGGGEGDITKGRTGKETASDDLYALMFGHADYNLSAPAQFQQKQGEKTLLRSASARGGLGSGKLSYDLMEFSQGNSSQDYWKNIGTLMELSGAGSAGQANYAQGLQAGYSGLTSAATQQYTAQGAQQMAFHGGIGNANRNSGSLMDDIFGGMGGGGSGGSGGGGGGGSPFSSIGGMFG